MPQKQNDTGDSQGSSMVWLPVTSPAQNGRNKVSKVRVRDIDCPRERQSIMLAVFQQSEDRICHPKASIFPPAEKGNCGNPKCLRS